MHRERRRLFGAGVLAGALAAGGGGTRVHPDRRWGGVNQARVAVANVLAEAIAPRWG